MIVRQRPLDHGSSTTAWPWFVNDRLTMVRQRPLNPPRSRQWTIQPY